jgi:hypothetical protein
MTPWYPVDTTKLSSKWPALDISPWLKSQSPALCPHWTRHLPLDNVLTSSCLQWSIGVFTTNALLGIANSLTICNRVQVALMTCKHFNCIGDSTLHRRLNKGTCISVFVPICNLSSGSVCELYGPYFESVIHFSRPRWSCVIMKPFLFCMHALISCKTLSNCHASYTSPHSSEEALMNADENLSYQSATKDGTLNTEET